MFGRHASRTDPLDTGEDPDPLAGATIVVHRASPTGVPAGVDPRAGLSPAWQRVRLYAGGLLLLLCFGLFGWQMWRGRSPAGLTVQPIGDVARGAEIRVYVSGGVAQPGVYRLAQGDRIEDAVRAAGGLTEEADGAKLNLAQRVRDEQRLDIPVRKPPEPPTVPGTREPGAGGSANDPPPSVATAPEQRDAPAEALPNGVPPGAGAIPTAARSSASGPPSSPTGSSTAVRRSAPTPRPTAFSGGKVNVNTATLAQLEQLPGIGEVSAKRIVAHREAQGPLRSTDDLRRAGLSETIIRRAADYLAFE